MWTRESTGVRGGAPSTTPIGRLARLGAGPLCQSAGLPGRGRAGSRRPRRRTAAHPWSGRTGAAAGRPRPRAPRGARPARPCLLDDDAAVQCLLQLASELLLATRSRALAGCRWWPRRPGPGPGTGARASSGPGCTRNMLRAPMVWSRSRSGRATTDRKPGGPGTSANWVQPLSGRPGRPPTRGRRSGSSRGTGLPRSAARRARAPAPARWSSPPPGAGRRVGDHEPRGVNVEQGHTVLGQAVQEVEHVVVVDQRVSQVDERCSDLLLPVIPGHKLPR